jgi:6-pyruvoyltetrahydropterin/6-carboxytetrahydropterin synthase
LLRRRSLDGTAAAAAPAAASRALGRAVGTRLLLALLRLWLGPAWLLRTTAAVLPLRPSLAAAAAGAALLFSLRALALLELGHLARQELSGLRLLPAAQLVMAAIRASAPPFRVRPFARGAENAFRQRHRESARIVHFGSMPPDDARRDTLRALMDLAEGSNPGDCWDDARAEDLLRRQSNAAEMRELGMSEQMIERVFGQPQTPAAGEFVVRVEARFEAAHYLREYRGITEPLHGHSYKVEAELAARGGGVDSDAIAVDFVSAKRKLEALAKRLDYGCINDVAPFTEINPSAENIARWFQRELAAAVADENATVRAVTVWEGPVNSVTFRPAP